MDPSYRRGFEGTAMIFLANGEYEKAIKDLEQYHKLIGNPLKGVSAMGHAYAVAGHTDKALECLEKLKEREKAEPGVIQDMDYVFLYTGLKNYDQAFYHVNKTYGQRMGIACLGMIFCVRYPLLKEFKSDARFKDLMEKMGMDR